MPEIGLPLISHDNVTISGFDRSKKPTLENERMELLAIALGLIGLHAVFVLAEYAFMKTAHSDLPVDHDNPPSAMSAAICRQLEDYLTVSTLARTLVLMSIGVLLWFYGQ